MRCRSVVASACVAWLAMVAVAVPVAAQDAVSRDIVVRGTVTASDGRPLDSIAVAVTPAGSVSSQLTLSDRDGRYRVQVPGGFARYLLVASHVGYATERIVILRTASETGEILRDVTLSAQTQRLEAVRTVATRPTPAREGANERPTPGANQSALDLSSGLTGDLTGDLTAALAMIPGVTLVPGANGAPGIASAFGLGGDQNSQTLNGMDLSGVVPPRDGLLNTIKISTYDPKVGKFSGVQVSSMLASGTPFSLQTVHLTLDDPALQWTPATARGLGTTYRNVIASGTVGGSLVRDKMFYNTAFQLDRRTSALSTLGTASATSLQSLGINVDSVSRLLAVAAGAGIPTTFAGAPSEAVVTHGALFGRIDLTPGAQRLVGEGPTLYLLGAVDFRDVEGTGSGPSALETRLARTTHRGAQFLAEFSPYIYDALNTTKVSFAYKEDRDQPYLLLPAASAFVNSSFGDGSSGAALLGFGGSANGGSQSRSWQGEVSNETAWMTLDGAHKFTLYLSADYAQMEHHRASNLLGTFAYSSIADVAAGRPSAYTRALNPLSSSGDAQHAVVALGDVWYVSKAARTPIPRDGNGLTVQYGLRVDADRFGERPVYNPLVASRFGARTDVVPSAATVEPMVGFTWNLGTVTATTGIARFSETRHVITGGIREYRGLVSPAMIDQVAQTTGLPSAAARLECVGAAAPTPNWPAYAQSTESIPPSCADGSGTSSLRQATPPVMMFSPNYAPSRSWRGELNYRWLFSGQLSGNAGVTYVTNVNQPSAFDLNFTGMPRFTLAAEGMRPVYVSTAGIAAGSGAVSSADSRQFADFAHVTQLRSDLRSEVRQFTTGLTWRYNTSVFFSPAASNPPRGNATVRVWYTYADSRALTRGFDGSTDGDPRIEQWTAGATNRHTFQLSLNAQLDRWFSITFAGRIASGFAFTPRVNSDINGDGYANDRAFVFVPTNTDDPTAAGGMARLLRDAPAEVRGCLQSQRGRIASANSCRSPWFAALGAMTVVIDPFRFGFGNRGNVTLVFDNVLGGLDELVHGSGHLQGWGTVALPDQTLLNVRGFDPAARQFIYTVNPQFGSATVSRAFRTPFKVSVDVRLDVSADHETQAMENLMRPLVADDRARDTTAVRARLLQAAGPFSVGIGPLLRSADSLQLTLEQRTALGQLDRRLTATRDSLYGRLAVFLVSLHGDYGSGAARAMWHETIERSLRATYATGRAARVVLTESQLSWLRKTNRIGVLEYSPDWLERTARAPFTIPR